MFITVGKKHRIQFLFAYIGVILFLFPSVGLTQTAWRDAINRVAAAEERYREYAHKRGVTWAGSMYHSGWEYTRHSCAILGRILGQVEAIRHLEEMEYPHLPEDGDEFVAHDALVFSISLGNWIAAAESALDMDVDARINTWNIECAGTEACPQCLGMGSSRPQADIIRNGDSLRIIGDIDLGFADRFEAALKENQDVKQIELGSNGGSVSDAIRAGILIREMGLDTVLAANCNSACPLVFIGGRQRIVWATGARFGLHQISRNGEPVPLDDRSYELVARYAQVMGADSVTLISIMHSALPSDMAYPKPEHYCQIGLATWVQRKCGF